MDKTQNTILSLLKQFQPMSPINLIKIAHTEIGSVDSTVEAYKRLVSNGKIISHPNGVITTAA